MATKNNTNSGFLSSDKVGPDFSLSGPAAFATRIMPRSEVEHLLASDRLLTALTTSEKVRQAIQLDLDVADRQDDLTPADVDWAGF
jgi:hypothetical protein